MQAICAGQPLQELVEPFDKKRAASGAMETQAQSQGAPLCEDLCNHTDPSAAKSDQAKSYQAKQRRIKKRNQVQLELNESNAHASAKETYSNLIHRSDIQRNEVEPKGHEASNSVEPIGKPATPSRSSCCCGHRLSEMGKREHQPILNFQSAHAPTPWRAQQVWCEMLRTEIHIPLISVCHPRRHARLQICSSQEGC